MKLELACFNPNSAQIAAESGVHRLELCANYAIGGTTPPLEWISTIREYYPGDMYVMIRPRGGDFCYNEAEIAQMKKDIIKFKEAGADGYVFGCLTNERYIAEAQCTALIELSDELPVTFHRAFDTIANSMEATEKLISLGFKAILSSGKNNTALEGVHLLTKLHKEFSKDIDIIPGGGVRSHNINIIKDNAEFPFVHTAAILQEGEDTDPLEIEKIMRAISK
jgi:copper homeostasis protein